MYRKVLVIGFILLLIGACVIPNTAQDFKKSAIPSTRGDWLYVGGSGPGNYTTIQSAINVAKSGDTIFIFNGVYPENITINKPIKIMGESKNVILNPSSGQITIRITANNVIISNINVTGYPEMGFFIHSAENIYINSIFIDNCSVSNSLQGFTIYYCYHIFIKDCIIKDNSYGIFLGIGDDYEITNCDIFLNDDFGIYASYSKNATIRHNNFYENGINAHDEYNTNSLWEYNYYDDYNGEDNNGDGIGDIPYGIHGGGEQDLYPYMEPNGWLKEPTSKKACIFGKITNPSNDGEYITFEAIKTRVTTFSPFSFTTYVSAEKLTISKNYKGLVGARFIVTFCEIII